MQSINYIQEHLMQLNTQTHANHTNIKVVGATKTVNCPLNVPERNSGRRAKRKDNIKILSLSLV